MTEDRKKPGVAFWSTVVLLVVLVAYPLSAGPLQWARAHGLLSQGMIDALTLFYSPIRWIHDIGPEALRQVLDWYLQLWG
jgi:hypothetical protein